MSKFLNKINANNSLIILDKKSKRKNKNRQKIFQI